MADSARFLLGLDAGNTVIKAVVFDLEGRQVSACAIDAQSARPEPGHVERDLEDLWRNASVAIRRCISDAGIDPAQIVAAGCAGHGNGLYLLDQDDRPLIGIQSIDTRAAELAEELAAEHGDDLHAASLQEPWPAQTPVLLSWMRRHRPQTMERAGTLLLCKDYITFKLTGRKVSDVSDMSGCGLLRMREGRYDDGLMSLYGLQGMEHLLPSLIEPIEIAGTVTAEAAAQTGLAEGMPVVGGYFDVIASALGSGAVAPGATSIIVGTWSVNQFVSSGPVVDRELQMVSAFGSGRYMNMSNSATSASHLEWYVRELVERGGHHDDPFGFCHRRLAEVVPRLDDPYFHPFLYGSSKGAEYRAGFYGLAGWHGEGHLLRALFEGVVLEHRRHVEVLRAAGAVFDQATLSGGGARSGPWAQMFADCLGVRINVPEAEECGALGAAIGAGVGVGVFAGYEEAAASMTRLRQVFEPNTDLRDHYDRRNEVYRELVTALQPFWARQHRYKTEPDEKKEAV
ncbi:FGGY-family carbohydrate kinase [Streptomyces sp. NPDC091377]|uniref:FGGY-family carbohydrate kinase n=1 Tax=Streptomyces sp. NPDC091377 TaxID=3365995 RepID=UPI00383B869D